MKYFYLDSFYLRQLYLYFWTTRNFMSFATFVYIFLLCFLFCFTVQTVFNFWLHATLFILKNAFVHEPILIGFLANALAHRIIHRKLLCKLGFIRKFSVSYLIEDLYILNKTRFLDSKQSSMISGFFNFF